MTIKNSKRSFFFMIAAAAMFLLAAGCSGDRDPSLAMVKKTGHIRIAMSTGFTPFSFYNEKKELVGFDVDVAGELAKRLGVKLEIVDTPWEGIIAGLLAKQYDGILSSMSVTQARSMEVGFSAPYYYSRTRVIVLGDSQLTRHADLKDKIVGVAAGTTFERDAGKIGPKSIRRYASDDEALLGLGKKEVDAVITDEIVGTYSANKKKLPIRILGAPLGEEKIAAAFRKEDKALLAAVNDALQSIQNEDVLRRLMHKIVRKGYDPPGL